VTSISQYEESCGVRTGTDDQRALATDAGDPLDHLPVCHDVGPARVERTPSIRHGRQRRVRGDVRGAISCVGVETHRGQIIPGGRSTSATIV
jgi:hypothetical protein